ncbi:MAG: hypothetical protein LWX00_05735 [Spirochaetia bacterium]|nr:hypothetical protein [Spirochaetia bacterium]
MIAVSVLFENPEDPRRASAFDMPDYFIDLNLDQILDGINGGLSEYGLQPMFFRHLANAQEVRSSTRQSTALSGKFNSTSPIWTISGR